MERAIGCMADEAVRPSSTATPKKGGRDTREGLGVGERSVTHRFRRAYEALVLRMIAHGPVEVGLNEKPVFTRRFHCSIVTHVRKHCLRTAQAPLPMLRKQFLHLLEEFRTCAVSPDGGVQPNAARIIGMHRCMLHGGSHVAPLNLDFQCIAVTITSEVQLQGFIAGQPYGSH
jgi:hypothetical protein